MATLDEIAERLLHWQEHQDGGDPRTPEELCADRPDLADELKRRIAALRDMEGLLGLNGAPSSTVEAGAAATGTSQRDWPTVPGYAILAELDRGGMGIVYQARQIGLNRLVALKMIRAGEAASPSQLQRFHSEAEAVARLRHPNIVQIFDVGEVDGRPFYSMEFMEGGSLADRLAEAPLPARTAAELVETLAGAIHAAHEAGIVHRDLKPGNILISDFGFRISDSPDGEANVGQPQIGIEPTIRNPQSAIRNPKISDFGLARRMDSDHGQTMSGAVLGTPSYMAPEQADGRSRTAGPAADIYALGAILYECLTGRPPFRGETALDTLEQARSHEPVRPRQLQPKVPRDLETICLKCLQKSPPRRYASAADLAADLGRFRNGEPIHARPVSLLTRGVAWTRKRPAVAASATLAALAVVALLGVWAYFTAQLHNETEAAKFERNQAQIQAGIANERRIEAELQTARAEALLRRACSVVDESAWALVERKPDVVKEIVPGGIFYNLARVNALASTAARQDKVLNTEDRNRLADQYVTRALDLLAHSRDAGFFQAKGKLDKLKTDADLEPLHARSEYRELVRRLEGPPRAGRDK